MNDLKVNKTTICQWQTSRRFQP